MDAIEIFIIKLCLIKHAKKTPKEYVWMYKSFSKKVVNIQSFCESMKRFTCMFHLRCSSLSAATWEGPRFRRIGEGR